MVTKVLNIEVGDRITKVCVSEKKTKGYQISGSFLFQNPVNAVQDGQIMDVQAMADLLKFQLQQNGAADVKNVIFTLLSTKVASREAVLPLVKDTRKIKDLVTLNASDYFPVDLSAYRIAHTVLERREGEDAGCRVQVTAAPLALLEGYHELSKAVGLRMEALDYSGNSQYQVLQVLQEEETVMYVDVNVSSALVTFMKGGVLLMQRIINAGGDELINTALSLSGKGEDMFLNMLKDSISSGALDYLMLGSQQEDCLSRLVNGIARSADFFKSAYTSSPVSKIVLMGVCGSLAHLEELLQREIGLETTTLKNVQGIEFAANSVGGISSYISCIGSLVAPLELLPEEWSGDEKKKKAASAKKKEKSETMAAAVFLFLLLTVAGIGMSAYSLLGYFSVENEKTRLESRRQELDYVRQVVDTYDTFQNTQSSLEQIRNFSKSNNSSLVAFMEELEREMPSTMFIMSAVCNDQSVMMNIVTPGMEEADVVISRLRKFESIGQMTVSTISKSVDDAGNSTTTFSVNCTYVEEQQEPNAPTGGAQEGN